MWIAALTTVLCVFYMSGRVEGQNLMLNKPCKQSITLENRSSYFANDGLKDGDYILTTNPNNPFWEGDLRGYYSISNITLTSGPGWCLKNANVGMSILEIESPDSEMVTCGQWPSTSHASHSITFTCPPGPARFVRVMRYGTDNRLCFDEVEVEGEPVAIKASNFEKTETEKLTLSTTSQTANDVYDCSALCVNSQPCLAFSFTSTTQPNCLLATNYNTTPDVDWATYTMQKFNKVPFCI